MKKIFPEAVVNLLDGAGIEYRLLHHEPTRTSEESAKVRGEPLEIGGKALLMLVAGEFRLFVLSAALKVDSRSVKEHFGVKRCRFATGDELEGLTGLVPGSVPPFGYPVLPFELFSDESILRSERIAFNAGIRTDSIIMRRSDWSAIAKPTVFAFSR